MPGRWVLVLALVLVLVLVSGCNIVVSRTPLFSSRDAAPGGRPLADGLWVAVGPSCVFDERLPVAHWPSCADHFMIKGPAIVSLVVNAPAAAGSPLESTRIRAARGRRPTRYLLADGSPAVLQVSDAGSRLYYYQGVAPEAFDATGRIRAMAVWPVLCGPLHEPDAHAGRTDALFEGLRFLDDGSTNCTASAAAAVRHAASESRAIGPVVKWRWVRSRADEAARSRRRPSARAPAEGSRTFAAKPDEAHAPHAAAGQ